MTGAVAFAGYAAVFDVVDRAGDVVRRGAFQRAGVVPLLWQHRGGAVERPCLYDASAVAAFAPVAIDSIRGTKTPAQIATLDAAGACLAASTAALAAAAKAKAPGCVTHLLTYLPTVLDAAAPEAKRANMPVG